MSDSGAASFLSQAEFARLLDVSRKTVTTWKKQAFLTSTQDGKVDVEATLAKLGERAGTYRGGATTLLPGNTSPAEGNTAPNATDLDRVKRWASDPNLPTAEALRRKENFLGLLRQLEFEREAGRLVPIDKVKAHVQAAFIGFRKAVQSMPARHSAQIAGTVGCDVVALDGELQRMIAETLTEMSAPVIRPNHET